MEETTIYSNELIEKNCSVLPNKARDFSSTNFWYYTSLGTANKILENQCVYASNLNIMNDIDEATLHKDEKEYIHCFCLCNSNSEKIPMWYLYAGISGQGVALGFTPSVMLKLINSIRTVSTPDGSVILHKDKDFDLEYGWIFYRKGEQKSQVCYRHRWYSLHDPENLESNNYFIKSYPWEYEKEFRIVLHNKTGIAYDRLVINLSDVYEEIKLKLAPEITKEVFADLRPQLNGIDRFLCKMPEHSKLEINMNLFKRNFDSFVEYIRNNSKSSDPDANLDYSAICSAISTQCAIKKKK